jgi:hypothetical protein
VHRACGDREEEGFVLARVKKKPRERGLKADHATVGQGGSSGRRAYGNGARSRGIVGIVGRSMGRRNLNAGRKFQVTTVTFFDLFA